MDRLWYFQRMLGPLIEGYWLSSCNLVRLLDNDMSEAEFSNITNTYAKERVAKGLATYGNNRFVLLSFATMKNTGGLNSLISLHIYISKTKVDHHYSRSCIGNVFL